MVLSVVGGVAASATGAHLNGNQRTADVLRYRALGGVIKSGILSFSWFVMKQQTMRVCFQYSAWLRALLELLLWLQQLCPVWSFTRVRFPQDDEIQPIFNGTNEIEAPNALLLASLAAGTPMLCGSTVRQSFCKQLPSVCLLRHKS